MERLAEAEAPILWPPDGKSWLIGKDPDAGKDWRQKELAEDEIVGQHQWFNGHEFEQTLRDCGGERSMAFAVHEVAKSQKWLSDWTITTNNGCYSKKFMLDLRWSPEDNIKGTMCIDFSIFWITCWKEVKFRIKNMDARILAFSWLNKDFGYSFLEHNILSLLKYMADMVLCTQTAQLFKPEFRPLRTLLVSNGETQEAHWPAPTGVIHIDFMLVLTIRLSLVSLLLTQTNIHS